MPSHAKYHPAPRLGQDRGDLTVEQLMEDEGEIGPGQRQERLQRDARNKAAGQQALQRLAAAAKQEQHAQQAARRQRKRK